MSCSSTEVSCTSAAANDDVWHVRAASARVERLARHREVGLHPRLVVVCPHVLLHFQLHAIPTGGEARGTEGALDPKRTSPQTHRPVAADVHVAGKQRSMVAANSD